MSRLKTLAFNSKWLYRYLQNQCSGIKQQEHSLKIDKKDLQGSIIENDQESTTTRLNVCQSGTMYLSHQASPSRFYSKIVTIAASSGPFLNRICICKRYSME
jgi:hypothetical protein